MRYFLLGLIVKFIASLDDTVAKIPIFTGMTRSREGRFAFAFGNLIAVVVAVVLAATVSYRFGDQSYFRYIAGGLILLLAIVVHFDLLTTRSVFVFKGPGLLWLHRRPSLRVIKLVGMGFVISFLTLLDDIVAFLPLFSGTFAQSFGAAVGIVVATVLQLTLVIFGTEQLQKLKHSKEIAVAGLALFGILTILGII